MNGALKECSGDRSYKRNCADCLLQGTTECATVTRPPHGGSSKESQCSLRNAGFSLFAVPARRESAISLRMNAIVDPNGPALAVVPSNPVPQGARVGMFE